MSTNSRSYATGERCAFCGSYILSNDTPYRRFNGRAWHTWCHERERRLTDTVLRWHVTNFTHTGALYARPDD